MYIVIGTRPNGREEHLRYETLDEAMQKVRDLVEADELDAPDNGTMFVRYAIEHDPPLPVDTDDEPAEVEFEDPLVFRPDFRNGGVPEN